MLQRRHFRNIARCFHRNYMVTLEQRWLVMSQRHCEDVGECTGKVFKVCFNASCGNPRQRNKII